MGGALTFMINSYAHATAPAAPAPYGSHIGWRILASANIDGGSRTSVGQLQLNDGNGSAISTGGATIFEGGTGTANSPASNAFDGNPAGGPWSRVSTSGGAGPFIGLIFGSAQGVAGFTMWNPPGSWGNIDGEAILSGKLQYSDNTTNGTDGTWADAFSFWEPSWSPVTQVSRTHPQTPATGQYKAFAWFPTLSNDGAHMAMSEAELFVGGGSTDVVDPNNSRYIASAGVTNPARLTDDSTGNYTELGATNRYVGVGLPTPIGPITGYSLGKYQFLTEAWKNWTLKGTNDGSTFTTLDTQTNQTWASNSTKSYSI